MKHGRFQFFVDSVLYKRNNFLFKELIVTSILFVLIGITSAKSELAEKNQQIKNIDYTLKIIMRASAFGDEKHLSDVIWKNGLTSKLFARSISTSLSFDQIHKNAKLESRGIMPFSAGTAFLYCIKAESDQKCAAFYFTENENIFLFKKIFISNNIEELHNSLEESESIDEILKKFTGN